MGKVRIITDSNAALPQEVLEAYSIEVIPQVLRVGRERYDESADFSVERFFQVLRENQVGGRAVLPELEAPNINRILDCYQKVGKQADQVIAIHMSSHLGPMWAQSRKAAEMMMGRYGIRVIDSLTTSMGLSILVEKAAKAAADGADLVEIARLINGTIPHLYVTFFSETLHYLERSAKLGSAQSVLGTMLGIKAMITMEDGKLIPLEKVQNREEVVEKLYNFTAEFSNLEEVGVVQHRYEQSQDAFAQHMRTGLPGVPVRILRYTPSLAAHLGPNVMGVIVYEGLV
ncbi:MAG: DegV family protein [Chloroflexi bacterium]|nr:DegV family protein [Chloroflexota bacterium]